MTTYFLDNTAAGANDSNAGTSVSAPFRTLAALNSRTFKPGDVISIKAGTSYSGTLTINEDGTATAPITFNSYGTGAKPVISGTSSNVIEMVNANYVILDGLHAMNAHRSGVRIDSASNHNIVRNMEIDRVGLGMTVDGQHNLLMGNQIHDLKMVTNTQGGDDDYGANGFLITGDNNEFSYNKIWNAKAPSYDYGMDGGGFEFWGTVNNAKIHDNWVQDSDGFLESGGQTGDVLSNISIDHNVSYNNTRFQYMHVAGGGSNFGVTIKNIDVAYNTIVEPNVTGWQIGFSAIPPSGTYSFDHNIVYSPKATSVYSRNAAYHTDNFYTVANVPSETGGRSGDPRFVSLAGADFHLQSGSAAEGLGAYIATGADFIL